MARQTAAEKAAARLAAGGNLPKASDFDAILDRLHEINDRMDADRATHMGDMNSVYEEGATELNLPKEVLAALYKADRRGRKDAKKAAKADQRTRESFQQAADAYLAVDPNSPLGQWAARQAKVGADAAATVKAADTEGEEEGE